METIGYILTAVTLIWLWDNKVREKVFFSPKKEYELKATYRIKLLRVIDTMPIIGEWLNCATCICFWTGLTLFIATSNIFFLPLVIYYKLIIKQI